MTLSQEQPNTAKGEDAALHSTLSSYREAMLEHLLVGELMRSLWPQPLEVCKPRVDAAGYDLILQCRGIIRHVQLKTSLENAATRMVTVHASLAGRIGGCVVWTRFHPKTFDPVEFWWFGGAPGQPLPDLDGFKVARHTKANAQGVKAERPAHRVVPQTAFKRLASLDELIECLFGQRDGGANANHSPQTHLPTHVCKAVAVVAWVMRQPGAEPAELTRFFEFVSADPNNINRWVEALSRMQQYAESHGGPGLGSGEFTRAVDWFLDEARKDRLIETKQTVLAAVQRDAGHI